MNSKERYAAVLKASIIGIAANVLLAAFKAVIGMITGSVAITMDAVNNFTDAGSSLITIITTSLAGRQPDKKHPFGYGRIEYLGTLLISGIILYAGVTALIESVNKIIHPQPVDYTVVSLVLVAAAVIVKILLGRFVSMIGKKVHSDALEASGKDAMGDSAISAATFAAALVYIFTKISIEAWIGAAISLLIVKAGLESLRDTVSRILGEVPDAALVRDIKKAIVESDEKIHGAYDLVLHNYGPDSYMASVHIAVDDSLTANEIDMLIRKLEVVILKEFNVHMSAVSIYSINTKDEEVGKTVQNIINLAKEQENVNSTHGFYVDHVGKMIRFDAVISFDAKDRTAVYNALLEKMKAAYPDYDIIIGMDIDFNEL